MNIIDKLMLKLGYSRGLNTPGGRDEYDDEIMLGGSTTSGENITHKKALMFAPVWRAVNLISNDIGRLPLVTMKHIDGGKEKDKEHPAYNLLRFKPNTEMTAMTFRAMLQAHALMIGSGYALIVRKGGGQPVELIPMDPATVTPVRENGALLYVYSGAAGSRKLPPSQVFHLQGLGYDMLSPYSVLAYARDSLGLGTSAHKYSATFFKHSARPSVVIEHPGNLSTEAAKNLKESWDRMYMGLDNSHRTAVLEEGMKLNPFTINASDAQLVETMKFSVLEIANWFGVPPHKLGDSSKVAYNSLEAENQSYLDQSLDPWLVKWEQECWDKLLTEDEKAADSHVIEFNRAALVRADINARAAYYQKALAGAPWMAIDEVRGLENLNSSGADTIIMPSNNFGPKAPPPAPPTKPDEPKQEPDTDMPMDEKTPPDESKTERKADTVLVETQKRLGIMEDVVRVALADIKARMRKRLAIHAEKHGRSGESLRQYLKCMEEEHGAPIWAAMEGLAMASADPEPDLGHVGALFSEVREVLRPFAEIMDREKFNAAIAKLKGKEHEG